MNRITPDFVLTHSEAKRSALLVLASIACQGEFEYVPIRVADICDQTGLSRATVQRALKTLDEMGELERQPGKGAGVPTVYRITIPTED